jgi:hypothetical protein
MKAKGTSVAADGGLTLCGQVYESKWSDEQPVG